MFQAPSSLLEALESHLANLEGRKVGSPSATTPTGYVQYLGLHFLDQWKNNIIQSLSILSYSYIILFFTSGAAATSSNQNEKLTQQLIKEEEEAMAKMKVSTYEKQ